MSLKVPCEGKIRSNSVPFLQFSAPSLKKSSTLKSLSNLHKVGGDFPLVAQWATSFEKLLQHPVGVSYFKDFLCKEFSEENLLFWLDCERLRQTPTESVENLNKQISSIYSTYLSSNASTPVNIDSNGSHLAQLATKSQPPSPSAFQNQQSQIFRLMKLDSYPRFLTSSCFQECLLAEMEETASICSTDSDGSFQQRLSSSKSFSKSFTVKRKMSLFNFKHERPPSTSSREELIKSIHTSSDDVSKSNDVTKICRVLLWDRTQCCVDCKNLPSVYDVIKPLCDSRNLKTSSVKVSKLTKFVETFEEGTNCEYKDEISLQEKSDDVINSTLLVELYDVIQVHVIESGRNVYVEVGEKKIVGDVIAGVKLGFDKGIIKTRHDVIKPDTLLSDLKEKYIQIEKKINDSPPKPTQNQDEMNRLLDLVSHLTKTSLIDQRAPISKSDLELPDFLKIKKP